jgi:hypothetical protein
MKINALIKRVNRLANFALAGLDPAIHAFERLKKGVDARIESG